MAGGFQIHIQSQSLISFYHIIIVAAGGALGSVMRYLASLLIKHNSFPFATLAVNMIGCGIMGLVMGWVLRTSGNNDWRLFLATGICGGFTTFSAFAWENIQLLEQQRYGSFILYTLISITAGLLAGLAGYWLTK